MENQKKKENQVTTNKNKWIILVTLFLIAIISTGIITVIASYKNNILANGKLSNNSQKTFENTVSIKELENVSNKSEKELQELNQKEIEKSEQTKKETKKNKKETQTPKKNKYYIKVNYNAQVVNVYTYDKNGNYTIPVKAFVCSTGTETPRSGVYRIPAKIEWCFMYGDVWAHYCSQIVGNILFHSVPYLEKNNHTLEYWAYDKLGTKASMGCIRLTTRDAKWIYENVTTGTQVEFYSSTNPGPLGKPSAQKVSNAPGNLKWWDPTDPDLNNPWRTYKPEENKNTNSEVNQNTQTENNVNNNTNTENNNTEQNNETNEQNTNIQNNETNEQNTNMQNSEVTNDTQNNETNNSEINKNTQNNEENNNSLNTQNNE